MIFDALTLVMAGIGFLAGFAAALSGMYMIIKKIRKEIGLFNRHRRYHPARATRKLHFENYAAAQPIPPEQAEEPLPTDAS